MKIVIYGKDWDAIQPVDEVLNSFKDVMSYSLISDGEGSIEDFIAAIGTGERGISGIIFAKVCPPDELIKAANYNLKSLILFTQFDTIASFNRITIGKAKDYLDKDNIISDVLKFRQQIEVNRIVNLRNNKEQIA